MLICAIPALLPALLPAPAQVLPAWAKAHFNGKFNGWTFNSKTTLTL
jgi:hypothetical protein